MHFRWGGAGGSGEWAASGDWAGCIGLPVAARRLGRLRILDELVVPSSDCSGVVIFTSSTLELVPEEARVSCALRACGGGRRAPAWAGRAPRWAARTLPTEPASARKHGVNATYDSGSDTRRGSRPRAGW